MQSKLSNGANGNGKSAEEQSELSEQSDCSVVSDSLTGEKDVKPQAPSALFAQSGGKKKPRGVPFVKGDPRINRRGRTPGSTDGLRKLLREIMGEVVRDRKGKALVDEETGEEITLLRKRLRQSLLTKNSQDLRLALEYTYGKPKEIIEHTGSVNLTWRELIELDGDPDKSVIENQDE